MKRKNTSPVKYLALGAAGIVLAALVVLLFFWRNSLEESGLPGSRQPGKPSREDTEVTVHSAREAIDLLQSLDLGYSNALSSLTELSSVTVSGDSYYRLQQTYKGIPVYGRNVIYAADEQGKELSVTQNIRDIPGGLDLTPSVKVWEVEDALLEYLANAYPDSDWPSHYANHNVEALPEFTLDPECLYIYDLDGSTHLAYEIYLESLYVMADAHTGQILQSMPTTVFEEATFLSTGETIQVGRMDDGTYVLKDEDTNTYVFTANNTTYNHYQYGYQEQQLIPVTSADNVFGDSNDSVSRTSMETARTCLQRINHIRQFYGDLATPDTRFMENLILVYDDKLENPNKPTTYDGENGYTSHGYAKHYLGTHFFDTTPLLAGNRATLIGIGTYYSSDPYQFADVFAHEYTHAISKKNVHWTKYEGEIGALDEAYSDILGELYESYLKQEEPNWLHGVLVKDGAVVYVNRSIRSPGGDPEYPTRGNRTYPTTMAEFVGGDPHIDSTIISHIAYKMYTGDPNTPGSAISTEDLTELWFRSMMMLPADAKFLDCREQITAAAQQMGLSKAQMAWISRCFDDAGIVECIPVDFQVQQGFAVDVLDADNTRCLNCQVTLRKGLASYGLKLSTEAPIVWNSSDSDRCYLKLEPGYYTLAVTAYGQPEATQTYILQVLPDDSAPKEIQVRINQGKSILNVSVTGKVSGREVSPDNVVMEIYRDNPNELVYIGSFHESNAELPIYLVPDKYTVIATARNYWPDQISLDMRNTSVRYSHAFLLEYIAPEDSQNPPAEITGGAPYEILTWERSQSGQTEGANWANRYVYSYVSLLGDDPAHRVINRDLYRLAAETMGQLDDTNLGQPHYENGLPCENYEQQYNSRVTHNGNGIISILITPNRAVTYSLYNGAPLGLYTLAGDDPDYYLETIRKAVLDSRQLTASAQNATLSDFAFVVMDGEIVILGIGSPGRTLYTPFTRMVHTGLYVSTTYTDKLQGTLLGTGGTGCASFEIRKLDNSHRKLGRPDCLQTLVATCEYPVLSGTPACGQINQEIFTLSQQFMAAFPTSLCNTSNRYEFHWDCNPYCTDEQIGYKHSSYSGVLYNQNGMLCYGMNWDILLNHYRDGQKYIGSERYDGLFGKVYDLQTGSVLTLEQVTGMDEKTQLLMLMDAYGRTYNQYFLNAMRIDYDPSEFSLVDPAFLIAKDGEIVLHFSVTETFDAAYLADMPKSAHTFSVSMPTGMYVLGS